MAGDTRSITIGQLRELLGTMSDDWRIRVGDALIVDTPSNKVRIAVTGPFFRQDGETFEHEVKCLPPYFSAIALSSTVGRLF